MKLRLRQAGRDDGIITLVCDLPAQSEAVLLSYRTRTGALLRVDGTVAGAYDREHHDVLVAPSNEARTLTLEVEREALPTNGLPSGPGLWWWLLNALSRQRPQHHVIVSLLDTRVNDALLGVLRQAQDDKSIPLIGHSHLDVAWLWTYEQTRRKAQRTFAIACDLFDRDPSFVFVQSQPQLYRFIEEDDPPLFERVCEEVRVKRLDPAVAALWVESDCNIPSGESLLRQMLFAYEYCMEKLGVSPSIAWLPDSFGFANTLPDLLAHAGIPYFMTTKLQWNDTTRFPYPQFIWEGPSGNSVVSALIQSYDGGPYPWRVRIARKRSEPLVLGYGDGGGGVTPKMLDEARELGPWIHPAQWFAQLAEGRSKLPVHRDELYLEYHRGVYTTHHDVKANNALLERALLEAEELLAWCRAVRAPAAAVAQFGERLRAAWQIALRNQFHDVLPGTAIAAVYDGAAREYAEALELTASVITSAESMLPRAAVPARRRCAPRAGGGGYVLENGFVRAVFAADGTLAELAAAGGRNVAVRCNEVTLYRDTPKQWEAWNIDGGYQQSKRTIAAEGVRSADDALEYDYAVGASPATMRVELRAGEPFVRVEVEIDWRERRRLLRVENVFAIDARSVTYGSPHGTIERSALRETPAERAKFEVPGQRFAFARDAHGAGAAMLALDTYGWSAQYDGARLSLGHSLLRGTSWPDPGADIGVHRIAYAFLPFEEVRVGRLERAWRSFAHEPRVNLFSCEDESVLVVACKPAENGDGAIVRVRECDGEKRRVRLRCGARALSAVSVDALERDLDVDVTLEAEDLAFELRPFEMRSFRVRFGHA